MATHEQWMDAIVNVLFAEENAGRPVYLDFEDEVLRQTALEAGVSRDAIADLAAAVRTSLDLSAGYTNPLGRQVDNLERWRRKARGRSRGELLEPPPCLPFLAILSIAAEQMGENSDYAANAFYPRVFGLLGISPGDTQRRFQRTYMRYAEGLWGALNEWLERLDGARGLPTAYALTYRYIGLALSQALVRSGDRLRLPQLFRELGLAPGAQVAPIDMVGLLAPWIERNPSPVSNSLRRLWAAGAAQERIAGVATLELEAWDGTAAEGADSGTSHDIRLMANIRKFPGRSLQLSVSVALPGSPQVAVVAVASATGNAPLLELERAADGWLRPRELSGIDQTSLLTGLLRLEDSDSGMVATRRPRPLVVLRLNELVGGFDETERVQLGADMLLLVKSEGGLAERVEQALHEIARPGFGRVDEIRGLPDGWVVFDRVQVMAVASTSLPTSLNPLVPLVSSQLSFAGGLKLPGRIRKFSSLLPPEIRAVSQHASSLRVALTAIGDGGVGVNREWVTATSAAVVSLQDEKLPDGDYAVHLFEDGKSDPKQQQTLRLRSGDTFDALMWEASPRLCYDLTTNEGWAVLSASEDAADSAAWIDGPSADGPQISPPTAAVAQAAAWTHPAPPAEVVGIAPAVIAQPDPTSCVVTGAHRIQLPPALGGRASQRSATIEGTCTSCGLVKRYPARPLSPRRLERAQSARPTVDVLRLPTVEGGAGDWDVVMDALMHTGGGDASYLDKLSAQIDESSLFADVFTRSLVALGHIQVERATDFRPARWEVSGSYIAEMPNGLFVLVGYWPSSLRANLAVAVRNHGGRVMKAAQQVDGPSIRKIFDLPSAALADAVADAGLSESVGIAPDAARKMASILPPLSAIRASLASVPLPGARAVERFDVGSSSWVKVVGVNRPGAYRLESSFMRGYVYVSPEGLQQWTCQRGSAQLVKHLAAAEAGAPLVAYDKATSQLSVALGADLPDMYGRVACLCSGALPVPVSTARSLVYQKVPADIAQAIASRLAN